MAKIKLLIVDDHQVVRKGLRLLFEDEKEIEIIGDAESGQEAMQSLKNHQPDIIMSDITMPDMNGIELTKYVSAHYPQIKIIILSMHLDEQYIMEALEAGAKGYLLKDADENDIVQSVYSVAKDETFLTSSVSNLLAKSYFNKKAAPAVPKVTSDTLTTREKEVLKLIVEGYSNKMIASDLIISQRTVSAHRYNIMKKLDAPNAATLVRIAFEYNLV